MAIANPPDLSASYNHTIDFTNQTTNGADPTGVYFALYYTIQNTTMDIAVVADVPLDGYIAFGNSLIGNMVFGDAAIGYIKSATGVGYFGSFFMGARYSGTAVICQGNGFGVCPVNDRPNCTDQYVLRNLTRISQYLIMEYTRSIASNQSCTFALQVDGSQYIIFALGSTTTSKTWPYNPAYHTARANVTLGITWRNAAIWPNGAALPPATTGVPTTAIPTTATATTGSGALLPPPRARVPLIEWLLPVLIIGGFVLAIGIIVISLLTKSRLKVV